MLFTDRICGWEGCVYPSSSQACPYWNYRLEWWSRGAWARNRFRNKGRHAWIGVEQRFFSFLVFSGCCSSCFTYRQSCCTLVSEQLQEQIFLLGTAVKAKDLVFSPCWNPQWSVQEAHSYYGQKAWFPQARDTVCDRAAVFPSSRPVMNCWDVSCMVQAQELQYDWIFQICCVCPVWQNKSVSPSCRAALHHHSDHVFRIPRQMTIKHLSGSREQGGVLVLNMVTPVKWNLDLIAGWCPAFAFSAIGKGTLERVRSCNLTLLVYFPGCCFALFSFHCSGSF